jgi:release factor glutamine methyltransferase
MMENQTTTTEARRARLRDVLSEGSRRLFDAGIESARVDAEVLLGHALDMTKEQLYVSSDKLLHDPQEKQYHKLLLRRIQREPVAYITGQKEFWSFDFIATSDVLIPRPETELLVEVGLERSAHFVDKTLQILDLGTGSGVITVCLAKERLEAEIWAVDISAAALEIAQINVERHGVSDRVHLMQGDLFAALGAEERLFDLIVSNPPYIRTGELSMLAPEIREWEPTVALDGGVDGIDSYRRIIGEGHRHLTTGGSIVLEIGADMASAVADLFSRSGYYGPASVYQDYAGKDRVIAAVKLLPSDDAPKSINRG